MSPNMFAFLRPIFLGNFFIFLVQFQTFLKIRWRFRFEYILSILTIISSVLINRWMWTFGGPQKLIAGYTQADILGYLIGALMASFIRTNWTTVYIFTQEIRTGTISRHLIKPVTLMSTYTAYWLADKSSVFLGMCLFFLIHELLRALGITDYMVFPFQPAAIFIYFLAIFGGMYISNQIYYMITLSAFWLEETAGLQMAYNMIAFILIGALFPPSFMPNLIKNCLEWTPFPLMASYPAQILIGKIAPENFDILTLKYLFWGLVLSQFRKLIWKFAQQRIDTLGG